MKRMFAAVMIQSAMFAAFVDMKLVTMRRRVVLRPNEIKC